MKIENDVFYGNLSEDCKLDLYLPEGDNYDTIVYFHGGGLEGGHKNDYYYVDMAKSFAQNGYGFASVEYRKYPNHKYPDFLEDCANATAFVLKNISSKGGSGKIYVSGQSAGAWISLMLCFNVELFDGVGVDRSLIKGYIVDSAQTTSHFTVIKRELGLDELAQRIDKFSPIYYVDKQTSFPKMLLVYYENDMPCRAEQNALLYKTLLAYDPKADVKILCLKGEHCAGSTKKDEDGEYPFVKQALSWLKG